MVFAQAICQVENDAELERKTNIGIAVSFIGVMIVLGYQFSINYLNTRSEITAAMNDH